MAYEFQTHYTREEVRALLPQLREWLAAAAQLRAELDKFERRLGGMMAAGCDLGGELVNTWVKTLARLDEILAEFQRREIQVKDIDRGLLDFPALLGEKEVFLCWEQDEEDVEFWHDLDAGYAGREHL
jgi:hypothetical protein